MMGKEISYKQKSKESKRGILILSKVDLRTKKITRERDTHTHRIL